MGGQVARSRVNRRARAFSPVALVTMMFRIVAGPSRCVSCDPQDRAGHRDAAKVRVMRCTEPWA